MSWVEGDVVYFSTRQASTELGREWWIWHSEGIMSSKITITTHQIGTGGPNADVRQVSINGTIPFAQKGPSWRRPGLVEDGYQYMDTTLGKTIWFVNGRWVDAVGNLVADSSYHDDSYPNNVGKVETTSVGDKMSQIRELDFEGKVIVTRDIEYNANGSIKSIKETKGDYVYTSTLNYVNGILDMSNPITRSVNMK